MPKVLKINLHIFAEEDISRKAWGMKLIFWLQTNKKASYRLIQSLWVCLAIHVQSTQNNKFTISLQYLKEYGKNEVDVLPADKGASTKNLCQASGLADYGF